MGKLLLDHDDYKNSSGFSWKRGPWYKGWKERQKRRCAYCGKRDPKHVDHVIPKSKGGSNDKSNLVYCCSDCNFKKGARNPEQAGMKIRYRKTSKVE